MPKGVYAHKKCSDIWRKHMSESQKIVQKLDSVRKKVGDGQRGRKKTSEHRKSISIAKLVSSWRSV